MKSVFAGGTGRLGVRGGTHRSKAFAWLDTVFVDDTERQGVLVWVAGVIVRGKGEVVVGLEPPVVSMTT